METLRILAMIRRKCDQECFVYTYVAREEKHRRSFVCVSYFRQFSYEVREIVANFLSLLGPRTPFNLALMLLEPNGFVTTLPDLLVLV